MHRKTQGHKADREQGQQRAEQLHAQKLRLARSQGPYYGGSLPNVNQIGRNPQDFQVTTTTLTHLMSFTSLV
ncbi:hypothetical protein PAMA_015676 [Pampus argenteus]